MMHNIIITHSSGIPLFARSLMCHIGKDCLNLSKDSTFTDETLLNSALMSAMLIFDKANPHQFHEFQLEKTKALTYPAEKTTVILYTDPQDILSEYENRLKLFSDLFNNRFKLLLDDFKGNIEPFTAFEEVIAREGLLEEGERFRKNCIECIYDKACAFRISIGPPERTFKERFESIKTIGLLKKLRLIMVGMFQPRYMKIFY